MSGQAGGPAAKARGSLKRKQPQHPDLTHRKRRRVEAQDARVIAAQTKGKAFGDGELDVERFVRAREFEIKALEHAMQKSKKSLTTRAFQNVPKDLRRRTASHNAKRVPKRLRARAKREMIDDNTPTVQARRRKPKPHMRLRLDTVKRLKTLERRPDLKRKEKQRSLKNEGKEGEINSTEAAEPAGRESIRTKIPRSKKNKLAKPSVPKAKFRKRQIHKAWLPTHLFHAKRAHMTPPKEPLWRMAIPLSPTAKSYRPTHRASNIRGAVAWDASYMSTISLEGRQANILEVLKSVGLGRGDAALSWSGNLTRWVNGTRSWEGWLYEPVSASAAPISPVQVVWVSEGNGHDVNGAHTATSTSRPATMKRKVIIRVHPSAFLQLWKSLLPLAKAQKPNVAVEDLRFEIGSLELVGPASAEVLVGVLQQLPRNSAAPNEAQENANFWHQLRTVTDPASLPANAVLNMEISDPRLHHRVEVEPSSSEDPESRQRLLKTLSDWPPDRDQAESKLFDRGHRLKACRQLPSQKAINRRKSQAGLGAAPEARETDPRIPIVLMTTKSSGSSRGCWTLLLPWKCIRVVWYCLMFYRLSGGNTIKFGGLDQKRQVALESGAPWFPADFPGTRAGLGWEQRERVKRKADWEKRPKGKRVEWSSVDLGKGRKGEVGEGWSCDWSSLFASDGENDDHEQRLRTMPSVVALSKLRGTPPVPEQEANSHELVTVKVEMLGRGVPNVCARIYRLPTNDTIARQKWLTLLESRKSGDGRAARPLGFAQTKDLAPHARRQHLAAILLEPEDASKVGDRGYPAVPDEADLIGFVTTGSFNLGEGKGVGIGSILFERVQSILPDIPAEQQRKERQLCVVRDAGQAFGRLARWHLAG